MMTGEHLLGGGILWCVWKKDCNIMGTTQLYFSQVFTFVIITSCFGHHLRAAFVSRIS